MLKAGRPSSVMVRVDRVHPDGDLVEVEHADVGWVSARENMVGALA